MEDIDLEVFQAKRKTIRELKWRKPRIPTMLYRLKVVAALKKSSKINRYLDEFLMVSLTIPKSYVKLPTCSERTQGFEG